MLDKKAKEFLDNPDKTIENGYKPSFFIVCTLVFKYYFIKNFRRFLREVKYFLYDSVAQAPKNLLRLILMLIKHVTLCVLLPVGCIVAYILTKKLQKKAAKNGKQANK